MSNPDTTSAPAQSRGVVELGADDLPAYCPNKSMTLWNEHPRVYLDVTKTGSATCPYCGTQYRLKPGTVVHGH